ncbi:inositol phosphorylceramide synthase [Nocardioides sp. GY 10113]|nr:inositol phosphorylceramide synthase [Nocardioides sp. GY 10113]
MMIRAGSILVITLAIDLVVRAIGSRALAVVRSWREGVEQGPRPSIREIAGERWRTHWTRERRRLVLVGMVCFYITYVCYRNLKSNLPFVRPDPDRAPGEVKALLFDRELHVMDRVLFFGHDPSDVLHGIFGTEYSAYVLSQVYVTFLPLVMIMVVIWLVWSRNVSYGYWFVTSQALAWTLGTLSYYLLPTLGPGIQYPSEYTDLVPTPTTDLMESIANGRSAVLYDPTVTDSLNSVAGFASLHCGITLLWALMVQYTVRSRALQVVFWVNFGLTVIATIYFGWHYVADDIAGIAIAIVSFYLGGLASGQKFDRGMHSHPTTTTSKVPVER